MKSCIHGSYKLYAISSVITKYTNTSLQFLKSSLAEKLKFESSNGLCYLRYSWYSLVKFCSQNFTANSGIHRFLSNDSLSVPPSRKTGKLCERLRDQLSQLFLTPSPSYTDYPLLPTPWRREPWYITFCIKSAAQLARATVKSIFDFDRAKGASIVHELTRG